MKKYQDILSLNPKIIFSDSKHARIYVYKNFDCAISYILLVSKDLQCVICGNKFDSLLQYIKHLKFTKKDSVEFILDKMHVFANPEDKEYEY